VAELLNVAQDSPAAGVDAGEVEVVIETVPKAVQLAPQINALIHENAGISVSEVARRLKIPWLLAQAGVQYLRTGTLPKTRPSGRSPTARPRRNRAA